MAKIYKLKDISTKTSLSKQSIRRYLIQYKLPHYRIGGKREIGMTEEQIDQLILHNSQLIDPSL